MVEYNLFSALLFIVTYGPSLYVKEHSTMLLRKCFDCYSSLKAFLMFTACITRHIYIHLIYPRYITMTCCVPPHKVTKNRCIHLILHLHKDPFVYVHHFIYPYSQGKTKKYSNNKNSWNFNFIKELFNLV